MRLDKFIGNNTNLSRTQIHIAIKQGLIAVNDIVIHKTNAQIQTGDSIFFKGEAITERKPRYLMLHKPAGYVSANSDSEHPTVLDLIDLPFKHDLHVAGRLDIDTTGLVLLTDDGQWNHKVTSPKHHHTKTYLITTADPIDKMAISLFAEGILLHGESKKTLPALLDIIDSHCARLSICEGKYHQVKRMFAALGNRVASLHRERIGAITLTADLPEGKFRQLTRDEINSVENS